MTALQLNRYIRKQFSPLTFERERHIYYWKGVKVPKSVSALVEEHADPFNEAKWLPICARKEKMTEHELKHKWQTINQLACELGTETHDWMEKFTGLQTPSTPQQSAGVKFFLEVLDDYEIVARELRMYSQEFDYAGTLDLLLRHKTTGALIIPDYKTNLDLFKEYGMLRPPFNYLGNCPYSHYILQFSYYQIMLEEIGLAIDKRWLVYLKADGTYKILDCYSFVDQLKAHLKERNKKLSYAAW